MPGAPLFEFDHVVVAPDGAPRILDVDHLEVPDEGITVIAGPSGAGKSTLLRLCNRLEVPSSGTIRHRGTDLATLDPLRLRRTVGMVFQRPTLFAGTVRQNLAVARPDGTDAVFVEALRRAGLDGSFLDRTGDDLSGGEAQRACLARTLLTDPAVLLMDEPTSALDPAMTRNLERAVRALATSGVPVLWVTHDLAQNRRIADRTVVLVGGRVADPSTSAAFLADADADADGAGPRGGRIPGPDDAGPDAGDGTPTVADAAAGDADTAAADARRRAGNDAGSHVGDRADG